MLQLLIKSMAKPGCYWVYNHIWCIATQPIPIQTHLLPLQ